MDLEDSAKFIKFVHVIVITYTFYPHEKESG